MDKVTTKDIERLFGRVCGYVDQPDRMVLQSGSPSAGRAWRLYVSTSNGGRGGLGTFLDLDNGYLGWTKREAYCTLTGLLSGLDACQGVVKLGSPSV
jgi:hypothetical protein